MKKNLSLIPSERIEQIIYVIHGHRVMLDMDLAMVYGVKTKALNRAVDRNNDRFPDDFAFYLKNKEWKILKCQIGTSKKGRGGKQKLPRVFTEHGAYAAAFVLRSERAKIMSVEVVRVFVHMRKILVSNEPFAKELHELKSFALKQAQKSDQEFRKVWRAIEKLAMPPPKEQPKIGFKLD